MPGTVVMLRNPFRPERDREVIAVAEPLSIREWLDARGIREAGTGEARTGRRQDWFDHPTICLRNGSPVPRGRWDETFVADGDLVVFVPLPQGGGGGGKNPLRTILMLAVMVAAPYRCRPRATRRASPSLSAGKSICKSGRCGTWRDNPGSSGYFEMENTADRWASGATGDQEKYLQICPQMAGKPR